MQNNNTTVKISNSMFDVFSFIKKIELSRNIDNIKISNNDIK
jgi:hypothetical protein